MKTKLTISILICVFIGISAYSQSFFDGKTAGSQHPPQSSIIGEAIKIDLSKSPDLPLYIPQPKSYKSGISGWFPVKGKVYFYSEDEPVGDIYHEIGPDGYLISQIIVSENSGLYDSTYSVMNSTPYSKGKDLIDTTYNYNRNADGTYVPALKMVNSYHYFDHFEGDSLFYATSLYTWDASANEWVNWRQQRVGFNDTLVEALNRLSEYVYGEGNIWESAFYAYDSIPRNNNGIVDTVYMIRNIGEGNKLNNKVCFTYGEAGEGFTQQKQLNKQGNVWNESYNRYDIEWHEWNGFTYTSQIVVGGPRPEYPYKISKLKSYKMTTSSGANYYYEKWWNLDDTKDNIDTTYTFINGKYRPTDNSAYFYDEHGNLKEWRGIGLLYDYNNGEITDTIANTHLFPRIYDETYGLTEIKMYWIRNYTELGINDTTFVDGIVYTDFEYYELSVPEYKENTKENLIISPNPTSGAVNIYASEEIKQLNIFNMAGSVVNKQYPASINTTFNAAGLPKGVYAVQAVLKTGKIQTGKLVVD